MADSLLDQPMFYGSRARIGLIVPPTNTANEAEWHTLAPEHVSIHSVRMPLHTDTTSAAGIAALRTDIEKYASDLALAEVDVIAYGCTAGSMVSPIDSLSKLITEATGCKAATTAQAIVEVLNALGARNISVATPYFDAMNQHEKTFLENNGFTVVCMDGLGYGEKGIEDFRNICRISPNDVEKLAHSVDRDNADALLLTCTDMTTLPIIESLEQALGKPVISSNTATLWYALRIAGISDNLTGAGMVFEKTR